MSTVNNIYLTFFSTCVLNVTKLQLLMLRKVEKTTLGLVV